VHTRFTEQETLLIAKSISVLLGSSRYVPSVDQHLADALRYVDAIAGVSPVSWPVLNSTSERAAVHALQRALGPPDQRWRRVVGRLFSRHFVVHLFLFPDESFESSTDYDPVRLVCGSVSESSSIRLLSVSIARPSLNSEILA
jgi:hypothetical protein